eukprot:CAMPEP_0169147908 /NCGR_PEP_ID=MMETSP1015-20121227/48519_1 /TAXON_ID=342587 /ORGANISM="Karlodinium micrum, Strain CCMP2283" /LENGTH=54 /DNA_ID=CAMNT_0009216243 /DNA_START=182 /DNA_END=346 /DNA_ORIENTATION=-
MPSHELTIAIQESAGSKNGYPLEALYRRASLDSLALCASCCNVSGHWLCPSTRE